MSKGKFYMNKWFLDFVGEDGTTMIIYAAKITWHGITVPYISLLKHTSESGISLKSRFSHINLPLKSDHSIIWNDGIFGLEGKWESCSPSIHCRIYETDNGFLDWNCFQPASKVRIKIEDKLYEGKGYAEQLVITFPPWEMPINELRWGRVGSNNLNLVWIQIKEKSNRQWIWLNSEKIENCSIEDNQIILHEQNMRIELDQKISLESESKIYIVVKKLIQYLPGLDKIIPISFLMAESHKWLSSVSILHNQDEIIEGKAIHEYVNFQKHNS